MIERHLIFISTMPSCAIVTCNHRSESVSIASDGISFHRFPHNPKMKEKWIEATGRGPVWRPSKRSTICSVHFKGIEFQPLPKSRRLFDWAVPTQKLPQIPKPSQSPKSPQIPKPPRIPKSLSSHDLTSKSNNTDFSKRISDIVELISAKKTAKNSGSKVSAFISPEKANSDDKVPDFISPEKANSDDKVPDSISLEKDNCASFSEPSTSTHDVQLVKDMENVKTPCKLKMCLQRYKSLLQQKNKTIRILQKQNSRYRKTITDLKDSLEELREKGIVNCDHVMRKTITDLKDVVKELREKEINK